MWFERYRVAMKSKGYNQSNVDHTLFFKQNGTLIACLIIYVDDMSIIGSDKEEIERHGKNLLMELEIKDLGRCIF